MGNYNIVIDTSILVSALKSNRGASFKILSLIASDKFQFHLSVPLVCEYEAVLKRSELGLVFTGDEFVAELAVKAQVDAIVTHNPRDFKGMEKFGIKVLIPKEFLQEIGEAK